MCKISRGTAVKPTVKEKHISLTFMNATLQTFERNNIEIFISTIRGLVLKNTFIIFFLLKHFCLIGFANERECHCRVANNSKRTLQALFYTEKVNIWKALTVYDFLKLKVESVASATDKQFETICSSH